VGITQSGETADTLAAMRLARKNGSKVIGVTNVMGSQATRDSDGVIFTRAGIEIGVAATKTFVSQVAVMYLLGLKLAQVRGTLSTERAAELAQQVKQLPHLISELLERIDAPVQEIAKRWSGAGFFLYLGRHVACPCASRERSSSRRSPTSPPMPTRAGEMKHGPIALLDEQTPVVVVAHGLAGARQGAVERRRGACAWRARDRGRD